MTNESPISLKHKQGRLERLQDERDALKMQVETRKYAPRRDQVRWGSLTERQCVYVTLDVLAS